MLNILSEGKKVFDIEINALQKMKDYLDETFVHILNLIISCTGKVVITGMGKSGHIAAKLAATFSSLGTASFYMHSGEAMHGDLGMISNNDIVIAISYSGESDEVLAIIPNIKRRGVQIIGITSNENSSLAKMADIVQILPHFEEACHLGLAPTASTTVELCYGDALAVVASEIYGFKETDFSMLHPAGSLGKKLIVRVEDLMAKNEDNPVVKENVTLKDAIVELSKKGLGIVSICDKENRLIGVITDGDLRRLMEKNVDIYALTVNEVMSRSPQYITSEALAIDALNQFKKLNISAMPVIKNGLLIGTIRIQDIIGIGIVG